MIEDMAMDRDDVEAKLLRVKCLGLRGDARLYH
jgi:hypothetical protein